MEPAELTVINVVLWQLAAVVKFVVTPSAMVAAGHSFWAAWGITSSGASMGVVCFGTLGNGGCDGWNRDGQIQTGSEGVYTSKTTHRSSSKMGWPAWVVVPVWTHFVPFASDHWGQIFQRHTRSDAIVDACVCVVGGHPDIRNLGNQTQFVMTPRPHFSTLTTPCGTLKPIHAWR